MRKRLNKTKGNGKKKVISTASSQYSGTRSVVIQFFYYPGGAKLPFRCQDFFTAFLLHYFYIFIALFCVFRFSHR